MGKGKEIALSKIQQAPESWPSRGLESEAVFLAGRHSLLAPPEAAEPKTFHGAARSLPASKPNVSSEKSQSRIAILQRQSSHTQTQSKFASQTPPTSPLSQTGKVIECDRDNHITEQSPRSLLDREGLRILGPRSNRPFTSHVICSVKLIFQGLAT